MTVEIAVKLMITARNMPCLLLWSMPAPSAAAAAAAVVVVFVEFIAIDQSKPGPMPWDDYSAG